MVLKAIKFVHFWIFTVKFKQIQSLYSVMVLKAMKNSLKKIDRKNILSKKISEKSFQSSEIFQSSEVQKCSEVQVKNNFAF